MTLRSAQFDDIYFSPEGGLAETQYIYLRGNDLPARWHGRASFTIAETGFGTGLNILAAWDLFERTAAPTQKLHFISFEKYPLPWPEIEQALSPWCEELGARIDRLRALYPLRIPGFHRLMLSDRVSLTLIFDDVNEALPQVEAPQGVDAWFLDGFSPSKNPQMWTPLVFSEMARLSHTETTVATFTIAGIVRRGLTAAGFTVARVPRPSRKSEMLTATYKGSPRTQAAMKIPSRIAIIGAGLAGTATAFHLKRLGLEPAIFEAGASIASGASGNPEGLFNPRLSAYRTPQSDYYVSAWAQAARRFAEGAPETHFNPCGSLHLVMDEEKRKKFSGALENWGWDSAHIRWLSPMEASEIAGVKITQEALYLPDAGTISPAALCAYWAREITVRLSTPVDRLEKDGEGWRVNGETFDAVILACGAVCTSFMGCEDLPLNTVRGQMTLVKQSPHSQLLKTNLCFGGYLSPARNGAHALGASFQPWLTEAAARDEDDRDNLARLESAVPGLGLHEISAQRVGFRAATRDRFPVIGPVPDADNLFLASGFGSHGLIGALAAAHVIGDQLTGMPRSLSRDSLAALDPARFWRRKRDI